MKGLPGDVESYMLQDFIRERPPGPSTILEGKQYLPINRFHCPRCDKVEFPEQNKSDYCNNCQLNWYLAGSVIYIWEKREGNDSDA